MTIFELVGQEVTAKDAAKLYGLRFDRSGRGFCPWHDDGKHAALQFFDDGGCFCHSCHAHGDAIAITAQMLGVTPMEAAEHIRADFHLDTPTTNRPDPTTTAKAKQRRDEREQERKPSRKPLKKRRMQPLSGVYGKGGDTVKIYPNRIYRSKVQGEAVVMPIATLGDKVQLYVGQQFGTRVLFIQNRRTTMTRDEFLANFEREGETV